MTQYPTHPPVSAAPGQAPVQVRPAKNTIGLIGFIVSLVSFITCGVLAPLGVLLSLIGLFKRPRGLAIAGLIIGLVLSVFGALVGAGLVAGYLGLKKGGGFLQQGMAMGLSQPGVQVFYQDNGRLPDDAEFDKILHDQVAQAPGFLSKNFQVDYRYEPIDATSYRMTTPGLDNVFDTSDDLSEVFQVYSSP
ncbi:MAG: DUF4190 domain-containing protein [Phycisphaeraceae bacterium]